MTKQQLKDHFPFANEAFFSLNSDPTDCQISNPKLKRNKKTALGRAVPGETESLQRVTVRFIGYRVRPLDPDNFAGGCKDLLDGLRHAQIIPGDEPWRIKLEAEQVKVSSYKQEKTVIEIC